MPASPDRSFHDFIRLFLQLYYAIEQLHLLMQFGFAQESI